MTELRCCRRTGARISTQQKRYDAYADIYWRAALQKDAADGNCHCKTVVRLLFHTKLLPS